MSIACPRRLRPVFVYENMCRLAQGFYDLDASSAGPVGGGLYTSTTTDGMNKGMHAVMLIGYGEYLVPSTGEYTFYWVFENSWGFDPKHDQGVFYMERGVDWCVHHSLFKSAARLLSDCIVF